MMAAEDGVNALVSRLRRRREWPAERRKAARTNAGVSARELALALGVTHVSVTNWEQEKHKSPKAWDLEDAYFDVLERLEKECA